MVSRQLALSVPLFGRAEKLRAIQSFLVEASVRRSPGIVRITGRSGYGKTALLSRALADAAQAGWVVLRTRCFRGQSRSAAAAMKGLVLADGLIESVDSRYLRGIETNLNSAAAAGRFERSFLGLLEGMLVDFRCLVALDDVQWADSATISALSVLLERGCSSSLVVMTTGREEDVELTGAVANLPVRLEALDPEASRAIVDQAAPHVPSEIAEAILARAAGIPFDLTALAGQAVLDGAVTLGDVSKSARTVYRRAFDDLSSDERKFLQLCAMAGNRVELRLLTHLFGDEEQLDRLIGATSGRFIVLEKGYVRFAHDLVAESIASTTRAPLGLRRRVLAAYLSIHDGSLENCDRIADLAAEIGDVETEFKYLTMLASAAHEQGAYETAVRAFERAFSVGNPPAAAHAKLYNEFGLALRLLGRYPQTKDVLEQALRRAIDHGFPGVGILASHLLIAICYVNDRDTALREYEDLKAKISDFAERQDVLAMGVYIAAEAQDLAKFDEARAELGPLAALSSRYAVTLSYMGEALLMGRLGRFEEAWRAIHAARTHVDRYRSAHRHSVETLAKQLRVRESGCAGFHVSMPGGDALAADAFGSATVPKLTELCLVELAAQVDFAKGRWSDVLAKVGSADVRSLRPSRERTMLLCLPVAASVFNGQTLDFADLVEAELAFWYARGAFQRTAPLAFWWAALIVATRPRDAAAIVEPLRPYLDYPVDAGCCSIPIARVVYAVRAKDSELLRAFAAPPSVERAPWHRAHDLLAKGAAMAALRDSSGRTELAEARRIFGALDAPFYAAYAANALGEATEDESDLLRSLGIEVARIRGTSGAGSRPKAQPFGAPTFREQQVAELVARGFSNRKIAEQLTISERTVEVHLSNIFGKLGLSSRTQLVRWAVEGRATTWPAAIVSTEFELPRSAI